jgi:hypothetical protein
MNPIKDLAHVFIEVFNVTSPTGIAASVAASGVVFGVTLLAIASVLTLVGVLITGRE